MRVAIGQFGGPTPVLNASLFGALEVFAAAGGEARGVRGGARGLEAGDLLPLDGPPQHWLLEAPGAALGAGRHRLDAEGLDRALQALRRAQCDALLVCGGNGTMALGAALADAAARSGAPLLVAGVPKTIDNDIEGTDHSPGYPSAATFVARAFRDLGTDLRAMAGFEDIRLVEVMGRDAGWLCGAAALARAHPADMPQLVLLPEVPVDPQALAEEVRRLHARDGSVLVAVAEGVRTADGRRPGAGALDAAGRRPVLGGAARTLAEVLRARLGLAVRGESLAFLPRCLASAATALDRSEARRLGRRAARELLAGRGGVMAALAPRAAGETRGAIRCVPLSDVAGRDRPLPPGMRDLGPAFAAWLAPLLDLPRPWPRVTW